MSGSQVQLGGTLIQSTSILASTYDMIFNLNNSGDFRVQDNGTDTMYINDTGYVGIGNTTPGVYKLNVTGSFIATDYFSGDGTLGATSTVSGLTFKDGLYVSGDVTSSSGSGDITAVGSMTTGDTFNSSSASDQWLGLGASAGRILFTSAATDKISFVGANVGIGTSSATALLTLASTSATESAPLGSELLSNSGWTLRTNWSGSWSTGFTHTTGSTSVLSNSLAATSGQYYLISYSNAGSTGGTFYIRFGGAQSNTYSGTTGSAKWGPRTISTGTFSVTPSTDFNGTLFISIKQITGEYSASYSIIDSGGNAVFDIRSSSSSLSNTFVGLDAGAYNTTGGTRNTGIGYQALSTNTTGYDNTAVGTRALQVNTYGYSNTAFGSGALINNTWGYQNNAMGFEAMYNATTSYDSNAQGYHALYNVTNGDENQGIGSYSLFTLTTGNQNTGVGSQTLYNANGSGNTGIGYLGGATITAGSYNTFIGYNAGFNGSQLATAVNSMALGYGAYTTASNQVVIGNSSVTQTLLNGKVGIGTTGPGYALDVQASSSPGYVAQIYNTSAAGSANGLLVNLGIANASRTSANKFIAFAGAGTVAGKIYGAASAVVYATTGADYGEYFLPEDKANKPGLGDIVSISEVKEQSVLKAVNPKKAIGVVSDTVGFLGNGPLCDIDDATCDADYEKTNVIVGLMGRVSTHVSTINGPISIGDALTSSSIPGVATKATTAGNIIGHALQNYTESDPNKIGKVVVYINPTWYDPTVYLTPAGDLQPITLIDTSTAPADTTTTDLTDITDAGSSVGIGTTGPSDLEVSGAIHVLETSDIVTTDDKIYNISGQLYWNGQKILTDATTATTVDNTNSAINVAEWYTVAKVETIITSETTPEATEITSSTTPDTTLTSDSTPITSETSPDTTILSDSTPIDSSSSPETVIVSETSPVTSETIITQISMGSGDVVALSGSLDENGSPTIRLANAYNDSGLLGVVTTASGEQNDSHAGKQLVITSGRVYVKIDPNSSDISSGDYVTSSQTEGFAIKSETSGKVLGIALENWTKGTDDSPTKDKIMILVNPTWYTPSLALDTTTSSSSTSGDVLSEMLSLRDELTAFADNLKDTLSAIGMSVSKDEKTGENKLTVDADMNVLGDVTVSDLNVTGNIQAGTVKIDTLENSIDTIGSSCYNSETDTLDSSLCKDQALKLQKSGSGNIDMFDGKVVMRPDGTIKVTGTIEAKKFAVNTKDTAAASAGKAVIPAGDTELEIKTSAINDNTLILVTPERPVAVGSKINSAKDGFVITLDKQEKTDLTVSWFLVEEKK